MEENAPAVLMVSSIYANVWMDTMVQIVKVGDNHGDYEGKGLVGLRQKAKTNFKRKFFPLVTEVNIIKNISFLLSHRLYL